MYCSPGQVWEGSAGPGLRHRVKDNFVQWQNKSSDGATMTFGLRLKTAELAHEVSNFCVVKNTKGAQ